MSESLTQALSDLEEENVLSFSTCRASSTRRSSWILWAGACRAPGAVGSSIMTKAMSSSATRRSALAFLTKPENMEALVKAAYDYGTLKT
jgi:hypothetical protein